MGVAAIAFPKFVLSRPVNEHTSKSRVMIKARYFEEMTDIKAIKCLLCPNNCVLKEGQSGICRTRFVDTGVLYTQAYGNPVAVHLDPIEKKPLYHFLPASKVLSFGTAGCNFRCLNCQNADISQVAPEDIHALDYSPEKLIQTAAELNSECIAFTYTEPTVFYEYMFDTAALAKKAGFKTMMISNGYINEAPLKELLTVMDAFNIDLKAFDNDIYRKLCGGQLEPVLNTLKTIKDSGKWLEITNLMVTNYTDKPDDFAKMADWLIENNFAEVPLHISRFFPAYKLADAEPTSISAMEKCYQMVIEKGIKYVYTCNLRTEAHENTMCPQCGSLLVSREGYTTKVAGLTANTCTQCGRIIPGVWTK